MYVRRREFESKCDSLLLTFSSFPLLSYSFFPAWPLSARPAVGASFVLLGTILRLRRRRRRRRWWWCWWWRCCLCRCLCWCCWWWWWWVLFIFGTCEKNTLEHIKLRMLKMLYGFSVRFISILYVLFIYIRLCLCWYFIPHPPTHTHTQSPLLLCHSVLCHPYLMFFNHSARGEFCVCVCECVWVRFQFRFQLFSLFFLKNDSETNRKIIGCCHCHVLAFFCFPFLFSCRINFFPATCSEFPNAS